MICMLRDCRLVRFRGELEKSVCEAFSGLLDVPASTSLLVPLAECAPAALTAAVLPPSSMEARKKAKAEAAATVQAEAEAAKAAAKAAAGAVRAAKAEASAAKKEGQGRDAWQWPHDSPRVRRPASFLIEGLGRSDPMTIRTTSATNVSSPRVKRLLPSELLPPMKV